MSSVVEYVKRQWLVLGGALLALGVVVWSAQEPQPPVRTVPEFIFTLVPTDATGLACSSGEALAGLRCGFDADGTALPGEPQLRPYTTTRGEVVLLAGVFEEPNVVRWLQESHRQEQTARKDGEAAPDTRVTLTCRGADLGRASTVGIRWGGDHGFEGMEDIAIGQVKECSVRHGQ